MAEKLSFADLKKLIDEKGIRNSGVVSKIRAALRDESGLDLVDTVLLRDLILEKAPDLL